MKTNLRALIYLLLLVSCEKSEVLLTNEISGQVRNSRGLGLKDIQIYYNATDYVLSDEAGNWTITNLKGSKTITPISDIYTFQPATYEVSEPSDKVWFKGTRIISPTERLVFNWFKAQQLPNGLLESVENGNTVSLYDNALAALVFMLNNDRYRAEKIFDFFNARIDSELKHGIGGFAQFRTASGQANQHRWMGDNAWLLIALNNYKQLTGSNEYDRLSAELSKWLIALQDTDGGLFAGYGADDQLLGYKVTEGNIDAFNAIAGYTDFHKGILQFLKKERWDEADENLVSWPSNPPYLYALDLHPWSYLIFEDYPVSALTSADRFLTTQTLKNGVQITGYCFDEDQDVVWLEGTGQMSLAFGKAGKTVEKEHYLGEIERAFQASTLHQNAGGFPYASNLGTAYGAGALWLGADTKIAISSGAWYLFAQYDFNPFEAGRVKEIPRNEMFWIF